MSDPATLDSIEDSLFAKLESLKPATFKSVERYAGDVSQQAIGEVCGGVTPAVLLGLESDDPIPGSEVETLDAGLVAQDCRARWRVLVVVEEPNAEKQAAKTAGGRMGYLALVAAVRAALNGLPIEGLVDGQKVHYVGTRKERIDPGMLYVHGLRFRTDYPADVTQPVLGGAPLLEIRGYVDGDVDVEITRAVTPDALVEGQAYGVTVNGVAVSHVLGVGEHLAALLASLAAQLTALDAFGVVSTNATSVLCTNDRSSAVTFTVPVRVAVATAPNPPFEELLMQFA